MHGLPKTAVDRISQRIMALSEIPRPPGVQKLHGSESYRIRVGDYRVGFVFEHGAVTFVRCLDRKEIYRYFP